MFPYEAAQPCEQKTVSVMREYKVRVRFNGYAETGSDHCKGSIVVGSEQGIAEKDGRRNG